VIALHETVVAPVLRALAPRRVVEIGALEGGTTMKLLDDLGADAELWVIDPVPQFDPSEHERRFPGRYHFHRAISHDVLPTLPPVDAALVDGDHNWYTVYHELKMLAATARDAGAPLPVMFLHDVGWPYGRRDLYYAPERIPDEHRQPYAQKGIRLRGRPGKEDGLLDRGGFNPTMNNALHEGGPRNGVMTAVDDFVSEHDGDLRVFVLPIYYGLAIVADEQRLRDRPQLAAVLDSFETPEFLREMLDLAETLRIREMHWGQVVFFHWQDRLQQGARRYLDLLKRDLDAGARLDALEECLTTIRTDKVDGDLVQCGGADPDVTVFLRAFAAAHDLSKVTLWVAGGDPVIALPVRDRAQDMLFVLATNWPEGEVEVTTAEPGQRPRTQSAPLADGLAVVPVPGPQVVTGLRIVGPEPDRAEEYAQIPGGGLLPDEVPRWLPQIAAWSGTGSLQSVQVRTDGATACRFTVNGLVEHVMSWNLFDQACAPVDGRLHLLLADDRQYSSVTGLAPEDATSVRLRWEDGTVTEVPVTPAPPYAFVDTSGRRPDRLISAEALDQRGDILATERP